MSLIEVKIVIVIIMNDLMIFSNGFYSLYAPDLPGSS